MTASCNALIFGAGGQDGHYLSTLLEGQGIAAMRIHRSPGPWATGDVSNWEEVEALVKAYRPTYLFHLAANSTTRHEALFEHHATIAGGSLNLLEAVRLHCPGTRVFIAGSGLQFRNSGAPISEVAEFNALSSYAVARIQAAYAARYYRSLGLRTYVGYLFHHESPLRKPQHVSKMIALAVRRIAEGSSESIELGDITVEKEWTFAGDVVAGIFTLVQQDAVFEACIGSGLPYSIEQWLEACFATIGKNWRKHVRQRDSFQPEYKRLVSNPATINSLGWNAMVGLHQLAAMMVERDCPDAMPTA